jgi:hypothetical protein
MGCQFVRSLLGGAAEYAELLIILAVLAAEFVDYKIQRRHHIETKNLPPHFSKRDRMGQELHALPIRHRHALHRLYSSRNPQVPH